MGYYYVLLDCLYGDEGHLGMFLATPRLALHEPLYAVKIQLFPLKPGKTWI